MDLNRDTAEITQEVLDRLAAEEEPYEDLGDTSSSEDEAARTARGVKPRQPPPGRESLPNEMTEEQLLGVGETRAERSVSDASAAFSTASNMTVAEADLTDDDEIDNSGNDEAEVEPAPRTAVRKQRPNSVRDLRKALEAKQQEEATIVTSGAARLAEDGLDAVPGRVTAFKAKHGGEAEEPEEPAAKVPPPTPPNKRRSVRNSIRGLSRGGPATTSNGSIGNINGGNKTTAEAVAEAAVAPATMTTAMKRTLSKETLANNAKAKEGKRAWIGWLNRKPKSKLTEEQEEEFSEEQAWRANPVKQGWMTKEGGRWKSWKRRWFVLQGNRLFYFEKPESELPIGVIKLSKDHTKIVEEPVTKATSRLASGCVFGIQTPERVWVMQADDEHERKDWMNCVERRLNGPTGGVGIGWFIATGGPSAPASLSSASARARKTVKIGGNVGPSGSGHKRSVSNPAVSVAAAANDAAAQLEADGRPNKVEIPAVPEAEEVDGAVSPVSPMSPMSEMDGEHGNDSATSEDEDDEDDIARDGGNMQHAASAGSLGLPDYDSSADEDEGGADEDEEEMAEAEAEAEAEVSSAVERKLSTVSDADVGALDVDTEAGAPVA